MRRIFFLFFVLLSAAAHAGTLTVDSIYSGGRWRSFRLFVPGAYSPATAAPLVLNLHGLGSNALEQELYSGFDAVADTAGCLLVYPQGRDTTAMGTTATYWEAFAATPGLNADVVFLSALIDTLAARYAVDEDRVYSTGMSNGGYMSYCLAWKLPAKIAAIASVTGSMTPDVYAAYAPGRAVPVMQIHGTADPVVPYAGAATSNIHTDTLMAYWVRNNGCSSTPATTAVPNTSTIDGCTAEHFVWSGGGAPVEFYKVTGGGHTWPGAFPIGPTCQDFKASVEIWRFFSAKSLAGPARTGSVPQKASSLRLSPNPCHSVLRVEGVTGGRLTVLDAEGRMVLSAVGAQLQVEALPAGTYLLQHEGKDGTRTGRFVKE